MHFLEDPEGHVDAVHLGQDHRIVFNRTDLCSGEEHARSLIDPARVGIFHADPVVAADAFSEAPEIDNHQGDGQQADRHKNAYPQIVGTFLRHEASIVAIFRTTVHKIPNDRILAVAQIVGRPIEMAAAFIEQCDAISDSITTDHVVSHDDGRHRELLLQPQNKAIDTIGHDGVKTRGGLIVENHLERGNNRAGQGDPFAHASA